jgi:hypothetical protein
MQTFKTNVRSANTKTMKTVSMFMSDEYDLCKIFVASGVDHTYITNTSITRGEIPSTHISKRHGAVRCRGSVLYKSVRLCMVLMLMTWMKSSSFILI